MPARIRRLVDSDRNDIVEISKHIWGGHDYLPGVLDEWLKKPSCYFYGVEVDGRIVAVGNMRLVDSDQTAWMEGLRVHPDYRGKGFANKITKFFVNKAKLLGVQRLRYTTGEKNFASLKLAKMAGFTKVSRMSVLWADKPGPLPPVKCYPKIVKAKPARIYRLLEASPSIIPIEVLVFDSKALDCTIENLQEIGKTYGFYVAVRKRKIDSLSFGHIRRDSDQISWSFTVYTNDSDGFLSQLSHNLALAFERGLSSIACTYESEFEKALKEAGWKRNENYWGMRLALLEKQLEARK